MIAFSTLGTRGRLGNQLFQYAALSALAKRNKWEMAIRDNIPEFQGQQNLLGNFQIPDDHRIPMTEIRKNTRPSLWREKDPSVFDPDFSKTVRDGDDISGYFENVRYFQDQWSFIKDDFRFKEEIERSANEWIHSIKASLGIKTLVSIHVRRGDRLSQFKKANFFGENPEILDPESAYGKYLSQAIACFNDVVYVVFTGGSIPPESIYEKHLSRAMVCFRNAVYGVFTGGSRTQERGDDLKWCQRNISGPSHVHRTGFSDILDFAVMSKCDHNILSHYSTFGWWAAFLNPNPGRIAIAPKDYFLDEKPGIPEGFFPEDFTVI